MILICMVSVLVFLVVLMVVFKKLREKIKGILLSVKNKFIWNGLIQSLNVAYIEICISCSTQLKMTINGSEYQKPSEKNVGIAMAVFVLSVPLLFAYMIQRNSRFFLLKSSAEKMGNLYTEIDINSLGKARYWVPITFLKRVAFVVIPLFAPAGWVQMQLLLFFYPLYIALYLRLRPHRVASKRRIELINEVLILFSIYNLVLFTPFVLN